MKKDVKVETGFPNNDPTIKLIQEIRRHVNGIIKAIERWVIAKNAVNEKTD